MNENSKEQEDQNEARPSVGEGAHDRLLCDGLNNTAKQIHEVAKSKGFWNTSECKNCDGIGDIVINMQDDYGICPDCQGTGYEQRNIGELLMLCVSELGEALEAHRKYGIRKYNLSGLESVLKNESIHDFIKGFEGHIKDSFQDEIADTIIRLLDLAAGLNIDIEKHMQLKFAYNQTRERLHGKTY